MHTLLWKGKRCFSYTKSDLSCAFSFQNGLVYGDKMRLDIRASWQVVTGVANKTDWTFIITFDIILRHPKQPSFTPAIVQNSSSVHYNVICISFCITIPCGVSSHTPRPDRLAADTVSVASVYSGPARPSVSEAQPRIPTILTYGS
jgi:hypothetical protein